jgi:hypothetical protein
VFEDVVLLAPNARDHHISRGIELLDKASALELETIDVKSTLACLKRLPISAAVSSITDALLDRGQTIVWQACCGIARWAELTRADYQPPLPGSLLLTLGTLVAERRHESLPLLLNTSRDVIQIVGTSVPGAFIDQLLHALDVLAAETPYDSPTSFFSFAARIRLRAVCVGLASSLRMCSGIDTAPIQKWMDIGKQDTFSEVRRAVP